MMSSSCVMYAKTGHTDACDDKDEVRKAQPWGPLEEPPLVPETVAVPVSAVDVQAVEE